MIGLPKDSVGRRRGLCKLRGFLAFFAAVEKGKVSTVIAMSSLYPVITIALSILFLHEKITAREGLGVAVRCWLVFCWRGNAVFHARLLHLQLLA